MPPLKPHITHHTPSSRPTGGFFISTNSPKKTRAELTKVNKQLITTSIAINYKDMIFPTTKPIPVIVNKMEVLTTHDLPLTTNYRVSTTCPAEAGLSDCCIIYLSNCRATAPPSPTFCPLFGTGKAFAVTFADDFQKKA